MEFRHKFHISQFISQIELLNFILLIKKFIFLSSFSHYIFQIQIIFPIISIISVIIPPVEVRSPEKIFCGSCGYYGVVFGIKTFHHHIVVIIIINVIIVIIIGAGVVHNLGTIKRVAECYVIFDGLIVCVLLVGTGDLGSLYIGYFEINNLLLGYMNLKN